MHAEQNVHKHYHGWNFKVAKILHTFSNTFSLIKSRKLLSHNNLTRLLKNKANLRDLIAMTGLVISNWIQIINFSARVTVKFGGWPRKTIGHFFYTTSSFVHHFKSIGEFKLDIDNDNDNDNERILLPCSRYIDTSNHTHSIHHYWYHLKCSTLDKHTWQTGLEAIAYVPQYLLNKMNVKWG